MPLLFYRQNPQGSIRSGHRSKNSLGLNPKGSTRVLTHPVSGKAQNSQGKIVVATRRKHAGFRRLGIPFWGRGWKEQSDGRGNHTKQAIFLKLPYTLELLCGAPKFLQVWGSKGVLRHLGSHRCLRQGHVRPAARLRSPKDADPG